MRERQFTARRRSGYRVHGSTVFLSAEEDHIFWKLRNLLWRTSQKRDYRHLFSKLDELMASPAIRPSDLEQQVLDFAADLEDGEMLRALVEDKQIIRKGTALSELRDRLSREGTRIVERQQMRITESQNRIKRAVALQRLQRLKELEYRVTCAVKCALHERRRRISEFQDRTRRAWSKAIPSKIISRIKESSPGVWYECELDQLDHELIACWRTTLKDGKRLEWARRGEKAALLYYRTGLRRVAEDISIQQLDSLATEWKTHDLRVDGRPLDVKNVRCPRLDRFQEHWWPDHKRDRERAQVAVVGSVSVPKADQSPEGSLVLLIGEVTDSDVRRLREDVNTAAKVAGLSLEIHPDRDWRYRLPGWLFEYPDDHYTSGPNWDDVLPRCRAISRDLGLPIAPWLVGLEAARCGPCSGIHGLKRIEETMFGFLRHVGLSRRTLFCFVLIYMLSHSDDSKAREALVDRIFHGDERSLPLGLHDPRNYVWHLLQALEQMIASNVDILHQATNFRLVGVNILQARIGSGRWHTILAYCGNCGRWPLFLGRSELCPCGRRRLVCDDPTCHSCGLNLPDCMTSVPHNR